MYKYILCLLLVSVLIGGCDYPQNYKGISWNVDLNIPLMNRTYPLIDLEDGTHIIVEGDQMSLVYKDDLNSEDVASQIRIDNKTSPTFPIIPEDIGLTVIVPIDETGITDEDIDVTYGLISSGFLKIEITEPIQELEQLNIVFDDIFTPEGKPFETIITDFSTEVTSYDLTGFYIGHETNEDVINELVFTVETSYQQTQEILGNIRIYFDDPIYFDYFRGYLKNREILIPDTDLAVGINYPYNLSNALQFSEIELQMTMDNELGFDTQFFGKLTGYNSKDDNSFTLEITREDRVFFARAEEIGQPVTSSVIIDKDQLVNLVNIFPEIIYLEDSKLIVGNEDNTIGFAHAVNTNNGNYSIITPALFSVFNETIVPDTVHTIEIDQDNREYIEKYPESVKLYLQLENSLPIGASVDIYFSDSPDTLHLFQPEPDSGIQTIVFSDNDVSAAVSDDQPHIDTIEIAMDREQIDLFLNEEVYFALKITLHDSDGAVSIKAYQYIKIVGRIELDLNIDL
jgi:hypothetical protein